MVSDKLSAPGAARMDNATRRQFLKGTAATVAATSIGVSKVVPATSLVKTISYGEFSITVLSDGYLTIPTRFLARNASDAEIKTAIGLNGDLVTPPCNITLVRTPGEMILIDVGAGPHYMPGAGKLADNLEAAGIDRKSVTKVVLTHAQPYVSQCLLRYVHVGVLSFGWPKTSQRVCRRIVGILHRARNATSRASGTGFT